MTEIKYEPILAIDAKIGDQLYDIEPTSTMAVKFTVVDISLEKSSIIMDSTDELAKFYSKEDNYYPFDLHSSSEWYRLIN